MVVCAEDTAVLRMGYNRLVRKVRELRIRMEWGKNYRCTKLRWILTSREDKQSHIRFSNKGEVRGSVPVLRAVCMPPPSMASSACWWRWRGNSYRMERFCPRAKNGENGLRKPFRPRKDKGRPGCCVIAGIGSWEAHGWDDRAGECGGPSQDDAASRRARPSSCLGGKRSGRHLHLSLELHGNCVHSQLPVASCRCTCSHHRSSAYEAAQPTAAQGEPETQGMTRHVTMICSIGARNRIREKRYELPYPTE
jgi:hypothetical protein